MSLNKEQLPDVLEVEHIQKFLGIGKNQAYDLVNSGQFHVVKIGRLKKVSREVFLKWFEGEEKTEVEAGER